MKRFSKILAILLTVSVLCGIIVTMAFADAPTTTENLGFINDFDGDEAAANSWIASNFVDGNSKGGPDASTRKVVGDDTNKYFQYAYLKDATKSSPYRFDLKTGIFDQINSGYTPEGGEKLKGVAAFQQALTDGKIKDLAQYSYYTVDFDITADKYRYLVEKTNEETGEPEITEELSSKSLEEIKAIDGVIEDSIRLSYSEGSYWNFDNRFIIQDGTNEDETPKYKISSRNQLYVYFHYDTTDSKWKIYQDVAYTQLIGVLDDKPGSWNHFTYVVSIDRTNVTSSNVALYFNGNLSSKVTLGGNGLHYFARAIDWSIAHYSETAFDNDVKYSMGIDNYVVNYYAADYTSGDAYGIDDLYKDNASDKYCNNVSITKCHDVVCSADYDFDGNNDVVATIGETKYYLGAAAIDAVKTGETVKIYKDLLNITAPFDVLYFDIECANDAICTVAESSKDLLVLEKTENGYRATAEYVYAKDHIYNDGTGTALFSSGTGVKATTYSTLTSVNKDGNDYLQYAYKATPTAAYRYDVNIGEYNLAKGYNVSNHSYMTVDFDICADKYVYTDGNGNQVLTDAVPDGITEYKLAYGEGMNIAWDGRYTNTATATAYKGMCATITASFKYVDGEWHVFVTDSAGTSVDSGYVLSDNLGEWNHFSYVIDVYSYSNNDGTYYQYSEIRLYLDGQLLMAKNINPVKTATYEITSRAIDWYPTSNSNFDKKFSVGIDNIAVNYYAKDYKSDGYNGIDDLFSVADSTTADYEGLVYHKGYKYPGSENGYVQINGGEKIYIPVLYNRAIEEASATAGTTVIATRDVLNIDPKGEFTFASSNGSVITLSDEAEKYYTVDVSESEGTTTYTVRKYAESEKLTLNWVDAANNNIATETLALGTAPSAAGKNATTYDIEAGRATVVKGWYFDLDGEGSAYSEKAISTLVVADVLEAGFNSVTVYPDIQEVTIPENPIYIAYVEDTKNDIVRLGDATVTNFASIANLNNTITNCYDNTVIKLVMAEDSILLNNSQKYEFEGKTVTFDLNGKTLTRINKDSYGTGMFRPGNGASFTFTSSKPGARVFLASKRGSTVAGNGNNRIFSADGLIDTQNNTEPKYVEISNIEFNGGSMIRFNGGYTLMASTPITSNDVSIECKISNVVAYSPHRSSYATIVSLTPDVIVNVEDSTFYVSDPTYSLLHDYGDTTTMRYEAEMDISMSGCKVLCMTEAEPPASPALAKFYYTMGDDSSLHIEDTKIIANLYRFKNVTFGPGVEIATNGTGYFTGVKYDQGVTGLINNKLTDIEISISYTRPDLTTDYKYFDEAGWKLVDTCYNKDNNVEITRSYKITFATYSEDNVPESIGSIKWNDESGNEVATSYQFVGSAITAPKTTADAGSPDVLTNWYEKTYAWADGSGNAPSVVKSGSNVFAPVSTVAVKIGGMKANLSLTTGMIFNLYLPMPDAPIVADSVKSSAAIGSSAESVQVGDVTMLKLSFVSELSDFEGKIISVDFSTESGENFAYDVKIDALAYATAVAKTYKTCGGVEAKLAHEIVAYKKAVAAFVEEELSSAESEAIAKFEAVFAEHGESCSCRTGYYDQAEIDAAGSIADYSEIGIKSFAFLLKPETNGLRIDVKEGVTVKSVTYTSLNGSELTHSAEDDSLVLIDNGDGERYYVVCGINAGDSTAEMTVTVTNGTEDTDATYSLAQYIKSTNADIAKALYSYAKAVEAFKKA